MGRRLPAGALATTLALALLTVPAAPAAADTATAPREIAVIPQKDATVPAHEAVIFAGRTGFLHRHNNSPDYRWTRYDTGQTVVVEDLAGVVPSALKPAGGDSLFTTAQVPARPAPGKVSLLDLADQSWQQWEIPADHTLWGVYGQRMLLRKGLTGVHLELRTPAADGTWTTTPVAGVPGDAGPTGLPPVGDETSVVVGYQAGGGQRMGLLDLATATVVRIPSGVPSSLWRLSGDTVAWMTSSGQYHLWSRSGLTSGTDTGARLVTVPQDSLLRTVVVDGGLVISRSQTNDTGEYFPAISVPVQTTAPRPTLLPKITWGLNALVQGPDGTALAVGGSGDADWAVHRIKGQPGQTPTVTPVLPVRDPVANAGLSYRRGLIRHVQSQVSPRSGATQYVAFSHPVFPDPDLSTSGGVLPLTPLPCATGVKCVRLVDSNDYGAAYLTFGSTNTAVLSHDVSQGYQQVPLPTTNGRIVDSSGPYLLVDDGASNDQHVFDVSQGRIVRTAARTGAGLWFTTLWTATGTAGQLAAVDLKAGKTVRTVSTGAACVPGEVQTSARWLWWACGATGPAGLYDLQNNRALPVPSGPALLGDGFLVRHDTAAASLVMTAFHDGALKPPVKLADLPAGTPADGRDLTWTVDRHGSGVAYVDAARAVHVIDAGVPSSPPQVGTVWSTEFGYPRLDHNNHWRAGVGLTRPLWSWQLAITRKWTGAVVHRASGGKARESVGLNWDGRLASGEPALNGAYTWTLTGTPTDTSAPVTVGSGQLVVACGTFPFRGYDCHGGPGLLGVKSNGEAHWYGTHAGATSPGRLYDNGYTDNWCLSCTGSARTSALVPFGDYNGDVYPDLLVRDGNGNMKAHLGMGQLHFGGRDTISLGAGWMMYRSILAPGDVNSDGKPDILGIDNDGKLWLYTTTGRGAINPRVQVGSGWGIYPRVIGAGDLNGDGHGDLLGIDSSGVMYHYLSNGNTGWSGRVRVYAGWNIYNSVVPIGDLDEDGRNDVVARDADGALWLYPGLGSGSFAARVKAGSGWNMYKIII